MTYEQFQTATDAQLQAEAKNLFDSGMKTGQDWRYYRLQEAHFYMQELDRRHDARIARRDFRMELIVIFLIGLELLSAIGAIWETFREGKEQAQILERQAVILERVEKASHAAANNALIGH